MGGRLHRTLSVTPPGNRHGSYCTKHMPEVQVDVPWLPGQTTMMCHEAMSLASESA